MATNPIWTEELSKKLEKEYATLGARGFVEKYNLSLTSKQVSNHALKCGLSMSASGRRRVRSELVTEYNKSAVGRRNRSEYLKSVWADAKR